MGSRSPRRKAYLIPSNALAWFGGAQLSLLDRSPSQRMRFSTLGLAVLMTGVYGGVAAALVAGYLLHQPPMHLWTLGLVWGVIISNLDRQLIMVSGNAKRLLGSIPLRLMLAIPIGILVAEVLLLRIFQPEEDAIIGQTQRGQIVQQVDALETFYQPKMAADAQVVSNAQTTLATLAAQVERFRFLAGCEAADTRCSTTHRTGCKVYCQHYQREASAALIRLDQRRSGLAASIRTAQKDAGRLNRERVAAEAKVHSLAALNTGLGAHKQALGQLQAQDNGINFIVWLLRAALILLDLAPVLLKAFLVLLGETSYDRLVKAEQANEGVAAYEVMQRADLDKHKIDNIIDAEWELDDVESEARKAWTINEILRRWHGSAPSYQSDRTSRTRPQAKPIGAESLSKFAHRATVHERSAVPFGAPLRHLALISVAVVTVIGVVMLLASTAGHAAIRVWWLVPLSGLAIIVLAVYSRGFRWAPIWAQQLTFGSSVLGLALVPLLLGINVL
jgi:hypothetical protein